MKIVLLTQPDCDLCEHAHAVLERVARDYTLEITTSSFASPEGRELAASAGIMFPPGILLDDEPFSYGRLSERRLRRALDRRLAGA